MNKNDCFRFYKHRKVVQCNVTLSTATKAMFESYLNNTLEADIDSYTFAIGIATSESK